MTIRINLEKEKEVILQRAAKEHGMGVSEYARMLLEEDLSRVSPKGPSRPWKIGMFPQLKDISEEDLKDAEWRPRNLDL